jgi:3-oxoacyl-[acyl-carrier protein] reductase
MDDEILRAFDLTGRVAVVTGAGGGIGRQAALVFAGAGAEVVLADVLGDRLEESAAALKAK